MSALACEPLVEAFENTELLRIPSLAEIDGFAHAITTRPWNMAPHHGPDRGLAVERRRSVCRHLGLSFDRLTAPEQIHSGHVVVVTEADEGAGRWGRADAVRFVDGLVCDRPGVPIIQHSADCPMIVVVDVERRALATAHASWRGTVARIAETLVALLARTAESSPASFQAALCPCAGPGRYEVGDDVRRIASVMLDGAERFFPVGASGRLFFDLRAANVAQLVAAGVPIENISVADRCTMSDERFYSHRRDGPDTGRFALLAGFLE